MSDYRAWKISRLGLPGTCNRAIRALGVRTIGDLTEVTEYELLQRHQIGEKRLALIKGRLDAAGLSLTPGLPDSITDLGAEIAKYEPSQPKVEQ